MRYTNFFWIILAACQGLMAQSVITLQEAIELAQRQSVAAKLAENIRENEQFLYQMYLAELRPQLTFQASLPDYSRDVLEVRQPDGGVLFLPRTQHTAVAGFSLLQQIPLTGGQLSVNTNFTRFDDLERGAAAYASAPVNVRLVQPLFGFNPFRWKKQVEPLKLDESRKQYKLRREEIAGQVVILYFDVLGARERARIAQANLDHSELIRQIETRRVALGTATREKLLQIELQALRARQTLQEATSQLANARLAFAAFLGLPDPAGFELDMPAGYFTGKIDEGVALQQARENRPEYAAFTRRKLEAARDVEAARLNRNQLNLQATLGFNGAGRRVGEIFDPLRGQQQLSVGIALPVLDWGRSQAAIGMAEANRQVVTYTDEQAASNLSAATASLVNNIGLLQQNIRFSMETDSIAKERFQLALELYQLGKLSVTELAMAQAEQDEARQSRLMALRLFWEAWYQLRRETLYDFKTGEKL